MKPAMQHHEPRTGVDAIVALVLGMVVQVSTMILNIFEHDLAWKILTTVILSTVSFFVWRVWNWVMEGGVHNVVVKVGEKLSALRARFYKMVKDVFW